MRHAAETVTDGHYSDPKLIDLRGALDVLPALPLDGLDPRQQWATGTDDALALARVLALNPDSRVHTQPILGESADRNGAPVAESSTRASVGDVEGKTRTASGVNKWHQQRATRLERATIILEGCTSSNVTAESRSIYEATDGRLVDNLADSVQNNPDLVLVVEAWDTLPEHVRAGVVAMVNAAADSAAGGG